MCERVCPVFVVETSKTDSDSRTPTERVKMYL